MPENLDDAQIRCQIEARIFLSPKGLSIVDLVKSFQQQTEDDILRHVNAIKDNYAEYGGALELNLFQNNVSFQIRPTIINSPHLKGFIAGNSLTKKEIEILAFIAYNQPIEIQDVIDFLGKGSKRIIKGLITKGLITTHPITIQSEDAAGNSKPQIVQELSTSDQFAYYLGISNDSELIKTKLDQVMGQFYGGL